MSNQLSRGDNQFHRLSSFLRWEGDLDAKNIQGIKQNVYYIEEMNGNKYILKGHSNEQAMKQQWQFFDQINARAVVGFVHFPNGKRKITAGTKYYWTISPYIAGRKLLFQRKEDRQNAVDTVKDFHSNAQHIYVKNPIKKQLFYKRWNMRLYKFSLTEHIFKEYGYSSLFHDITQTMKMYVSIVSNYAWYKDQLEAERKGEWVHGDVASHNFIKNSQTYLIDFDLLQCTTKLYDYIQLGQRFLPHINWDVHQLLNYQMVDESDLERFLYSVFIPSDLLREWLHFLNRGTRTGAKDYLETMEDEWINRKKFLNMSKIVVK